jgi:hypothetical protein
MGLMGLLECPLTGEKCREGKCRFFSNIDYECALLFVVWETYHKIKEDDEGDSE